MSVKTKLKRVLSTLETVQRKLNSAKHDAGDAYSDISAAVRELAEAESQLRSAIRNLPEA